MNWIKRLKSARHDRRTLERIADLCIDHKRLSDRTLTEDRRRIHDALTRELASSSAGAMVVGAQQAFTVPGNEDLDSLALLSNGLLAHPDPVVRYLAACALCVTPDPDSLALAPLLAALKDSVVWVRRAAASALCRNGSIQALSAVVGGSGHGHGVRTAAAWAIAALGAQGAPAIPALFNLLRDRDINYRSHWAAVEALVQIGPAAIPAITAAMEDPDPEVREYASIALRDADEIRSCYARRRSGVP